MKKKLYNTLKKYGNNLQYTSKFKFANIKRKATNVESKIIYWGENEIDNLGKTSTFTSNSF